jgi:hypothetical protein
MECMEVHRDAPCFFVDVMPVRIPMAIGMTAHRRTSKANEIMVYKLDPASTHPIAA